MMFEHSVIYEVMKKMDWNAVHLIFYFLELCDENEKTLFLEP